jgi:hypothetical protein
LGASPWVCAAPDAFTQPGRPAAADQLGRANTSMTSDVYFGRKILATGAAAVLEIIGI